MLTAWVSEKRCLDGFYVHQNSEECVSGAFYRLGVGYVREWNKIRSEKPYNPTAPRSRSVTLDYMTSLNCVVAGLGNRG